MGHHGNDPRLTALSSRGHDEASVWDVRISARTVTATLAAIITVLVLADVAGQIATYNFGHPTVFGLVPLFDLDRESNVPAWYSASVLLICAEALALVAFAKRRAGDRYRWQWAGLAVGFLYLSADEGAGIHEFIGPLFAGVGHWLTLHVSSYFRYLAAEPVFTWVLPACAAVAIIGIFYLKFLFALPRRTAVFFVLAAAIYLGGAIGVEAIGARHVLLYGRGDAVYGVLVILEESMEMSGIALFLYAVLRYAAAEIRSMYLQFETMSSVAHESVNPAIASRDLPTALNHGRLPPRQV
jgi:hypothetical protein